MDKNKTVLITGCCGLIGSNLYNRLRHDNRYTVMGCDSLQFGYLANIGIETFDDAEKHNVLCVDFDNLPQSLLDKVDILAHLGTANLIQAAEYPVETFMTNAYKTIRLFEKFKGKIVYTSTSSIYGQADIFPTPETAEIKLSNSYDQSKMIAQLFLSQRGNFTSLILTNTYGENQRPEHPFSGVVGKLIGQALNGKPLEIIGGTQTRDYTYVGDVVDALIMAIEQDAKNECINIGTGIESSMYDLTRIIKTHAYDNGKSFTIKGMPARSIDKINRRCLNIERANYILNWQPKTTLAEGIKRTVEWQLKEYHANL